MQILLLMGWRRPEGSIPAVATPAVAILQEYGTRRASNPTPDQGTNAESPKYYKKLGINLAEKEL